jgi:hypothetical protein
MRLVKILMVLRESQLRFPGTPVSVWLALAFFFFLSFHLVHQDNFIFALDTSSFIFALQFIFGLSML